MSKRAFMTSFVYGGVPDKTISPNGQDFSADKLFLLVGNHPIGLDERVYFEFTVKSYTQSTVLKYFPIYVGIHKDPTSGTLSNDFCLGSVFYSVQTGQYSVMEKHLKTASTKTSNPGTASTRPPASDEIVGVAIDRKKNIITIYVEGKKLYSFKPSLFNMAKETASFYPALYSNIPADMEGIIEMGAGGCKYVPSEYKTVFQWHNKDKVKKDIIGQLTVNKPAPRDMAGFIGSITVTDIKGNGSIKSITTSSTNTVKSDYLSFKINDDKGVIHTNLPLPYRYKTYTELYVRDGILQMNEFGIPLMIGITDSPDNIYGGNTVQIPLHHKREHCYEYYERIGSSVTTKVINDTFTSVPNEEGKYIGIGVDLKARTIDVWIDKVHFYTYQITRFRPNTGFYLYIKGDKSFTNYITGNFNYGADEATDPRNNPFKMDIPDEYMSLWHYYNRLVFHPVPNIPEINGIGLTIIDKFTLFSRYLYGYVNVKEYVTSQMAKFGNGLNWMMDTYNTITDRYDYAPGTANYNSHEDHHDEIYITGLTDTEYNNLIASENNGYYPNNPDNPE